MEYKISSKANITTILLIVIGLAAFLIGLFTSHGHTSQRLWANLLVNGYFFFTISLASLFFLALQFISEMAWGVTTQRIFQATMSFMPFSAVALLLVFIGGSLHWNHIYHWMVEGITDPTSHHYDEIIANKSAYLNQPFFWVRTIAYFAVWMFFANWFRKKSLAEDQLSLAKGETSPIYKKSIFMGVLFVAFFAYTSSSSAWDWLMSIDVHWFSTMYGWYSFSGMWISSMIVVLLLVLYLKSQGYLKEVNDSHIHDLGKWMFAISMLWSYLWFSQFMLIWYSDIPEEVTYYIERFNDYKLLYMGTFFVNFILPFFVLMSRDAKKNVIFLVPVALILFFTHWLDVLTMVLPGTMHNHGGLGAIEIGMFLMFLGAFLMVTLRSIAKAPLMTKNHPMYDESVHLHT
tara:strand:- start:10280 stop:11488 length:1209 start_codon:yes stop_codon:yes gene_type:complete